MPSKQQHVAPHGQCVPRRSMKLALHSRQEQDACPTTWTSQGAATSHRHAERHKAQDANKKPPNDNSWGEASDPGFIGRRGGLRPEFLETSFLSPWAGGEAAKNMKTVLSGSSPSGRNEDIAGEAGSKRQFLNPVVDCTNQTLSAYGG